MANKKISELQSRTPALSDLMLVGDPSSGYSYKCTVTALATIIETDIADGYVTIGTTQTISGAKTFSNNLTLTSVVNTPTDPDKFLTLNASNVVTYRTGAEVLSDIGGVGGSGTTNYLPKFSATTTLANSQIFDNGTNIGIATATPDATARVQIDKTDGYGLYLNYNTSTGSGVTTTALYAINTTASSGYAAVIEEKTPNTTAGQYPFVIKHSLSSGTAGVGFGTGVHFQLLDDAGTSKTTQLTIENIDAAAATYKTRYRFNVQNNGSSTPVVYINGTGLGVFTASPSVALDVTGEGKFSTINNATTDTDKFLVSDSGVLKYRTGAEVLSDIGAASSSSISGTTNYLAKFTSSSAVGNSQIFDNGTNVGIGTNTPTRTLDVNGIITTNNNLELTSANPTILWTTSNLRFYNNTNGVVATISSAGQLSLSSIPNATTDTDKFLVSDGGVIKYRTGSEVLSDIGAASSSSISGTTNYIPKFTSSSAIGNSDLLTDGSGNLAVAQGNAPTQALNIYRAGSTQTVMSAGNSNTGLNGTFFGVDANGNGIINTTGAFANIFSTNGSERMRLTSGGLLGLGTSSPSNKLTVQVSAGQDAINWNDGARNGYLYVDGAGVGVFSGAGATNQGIYLNNTSSYLAAFTSGSERMRLDASGNLNLGQSTSALQSGGTGLTIYGSSASEIKFLNSSTGSAATDGTALVTSSLDFSINNREAGSLIFGTSNAERARIDASGNLLVGGTSGDGKLYVQTSTAVAYSSIDYNGTNANLRLKSGGSPTTNTTAGISFGVGGSAEIYIGAVQQANTYANLVFQTFGPGAVYSTKMTLDASGNLGLGVTPTNGTGDVTHFEISSGGRFVAAGNNAEVGANYYYDNAYKYITSNAVTRLEMNGGAFKFYNASSGTAGNAISFTQAMTLDASGNLRLGATGALATNDKLTIASTAADCFGVFQQTSGITAIFGVDGTGAYSGSLTNQAYVFRTNNTERMRITSLGNVGIGTTSPQANLVVQNTSGTSIPSLGSQGGHFQLQNGTYGLLAGVAGSGNVWMQAQRTDGTATAYNLLLQPSGGNVGIGTTSPTAKLHINDGTNTNLRMYGSSGVFVVSAENDAGSAQIPLSFNNAMRITSGGNVGIGTSAPNSILEVNKSITFSNIDDYGQFAIKSTTGANGKMLNFGVDEANNVGFIQAVNRGIDVIPLVLQRYGGRVGIGYTAPTEALAINGNLAVGSTASSGYKLFVNGSAYIAGSTNYIDGSTIFRTAAAAEMARFTSSGELLINTTSDAGDYKLQVNGNGLFTNSATSLLEVRATNTGGTAQILLNPVNNNSYTIQTNGSTDNLTFIRNSTTLATISNVGNADFSGSIKTAAPSGGTAKPWKLGEAGVTLGGSNTSGVRVEIDGVVYYLVTGYLP